MSEQNEDTSPPEPMIDRGRRGGGAMLSYPADSSQVSVADGSGEVKILAFHQDGQNLDGRPTPVTYTLQNAYPVGPDGRSTGPLYQRLDPEEVAGLLGGDPNIPGGDPQVMDMLKSLEHVKLTLAVGPEPLEELARAAAEELARGAVGSTSAMEYADLNQESHESFSPSSSFTGPTDISYDPSRDR